MNVETRNVDVSLQAALAEANALAEFYRTRCLIQAQQILDLTSAGMTLQAEIERLHAQALPPEDGEPTFDSREVANDPYERAADEAGAEAYASLREAE